ncbi:class I SAM-dependent methyltransferase [bacterium]|nr:class I SAM-dependent methyltransferase [bacterium]
MKNFKKVLNHLKHPPIPISPKDKGIIKKLKEEFEHNKRTFIFNRFKYYVDCLYCHAMPGTIEKVLLILNSFKIKQGENNKLLNLGGGTGQVSDMIKYIGFDVYNLDIEVSDEDEFNKQHNLNDFIDLPYEENSFNFVLCQEVIEHIENPWKLFRDIKRVLKDNGTLILTTPNIQSKHSKKVFSRNHFGYFNWFGEKDLSYHINPVPFWEIELIASKSGFLFKLLDGNGSYYFSKKLSREKTIDKNENLIFVYEKIDDKKGK